MSRDDRRIALLCIDPAEDEGVLSLNYSTRKLVAALRSPPEPEGIDVHLVESREKDPAEFLERLEEIDADLVGASAYVWSMPTFIEVAREWKRRRPDSLVVFGGPSARPRMFAHTPFAGAPEFIDAFVEGEGEQALREIVAMDAYDRESLGNVEGIQVSVGNGWKPTAPRTVRADISSFGSPYTMGLLGRHETGLVETFRGCPFACTFCQWGDAREMDRTFTAEYIANDLRALAGLDAKGAALIDAGLNLNQRAFANLAEAEREVGFFKNRNFYCEVYPSHLSRDQIDFLENVQADRLSVGLQSFDAEVLNEIQRRFDEENFRRVVTTLAGIANLVTVEIIMGLPGDNPRSFLDTLDRLLDLPCEARVFHCLVLPDALMDRAAPGANMVYDPSSLQMVSCKGWPEGEIARMRKLLDKRAAEMGGIAMKDWWEFPGRQMGRSTAAPEAGRESIRVGGTEPAAENGPAPLAEAEHAAIAASVDRATGGAWSLQTAERVRGELLVRMSTPEGPLALDIVAANAQAPSYSYVNGFAYRYRNGEGDGPSAGTLNQLDRVIEELSLVIPR